MQLGPVRFGSSKYGASEAGYARERPKGFSQLVFDLLKLAQ